ncbi:armadillo repeat containing 7 isoform 1 family protein [Thraustotheca clavata]|uniref:Armadillo repeat containing 7 isoform 1 family protein n=1 Tax=Thraustotheca clavata TaxID=74557 RepID=A0A1W0A0G9_9STRA|nr:armadillo repeat containing 7 isoform 1 family protein [Thraustotheca clavata]
MLSSHARLRARESSKEGSLPRQGYLAKLVAECAHEQTAKDSKLQCLAHLANFAYDPINYDHFLRLNVADLFVDTLEEALQSNAAEFQRLTTQGICNLAPDTRFQKVLIESDIVPLLLTACKSTDITTITASIATLFFLLDAPPSITQRNVLVENRKVYDCIQNCTQHANPIVRNTAMAYLSRQASILEESAG